MIRSFYFAAFLVLCAACKKEEPPAPAPAPEASPAPPAAEAPQATAAPAAAVDVENLPVEEDFEAEAEQQVTAANLNQKLDELEKEIAAE
jgi:hypothetical protein